MGTKIKMVDFKRPFFYSKKGGTIKLSTKASNRCLKNAKIIPSDLGSIIYTGIYRDKNLVEPAIASLIQKKNFTSSKMRK